MTPVPAQVQLAHEKVPSAGSTGIAAGGGVVQVAFDHVPRGPKKAYPRSAAVSPSVYQCQLNRGRAPDVRRGPTSADQPASSRPSVWTNGKPRRSPRRLGPDVLQPPEPQAVIAQDDGPTVAEPSGVRGGGFGPGRAADRARLDSRLPTPGPGAFAGPARSRAAGRHPALAAGRPPPESPTAQPGGAARSAPWLQVRR